MVAGLSLNLVNVSCCFAISFTDTLVLLQLLPTVIDLSEFCQCEETHGKTATDMSNWGLFYFNLNLFQK